MVSEIRICCSANQWNDEIKTRKLPTLLEGEALASWLELSYEQQADYKVAKEQLITKMAPNEFVSLEVFCPIRIYWPIRVWDVPYAYTHMGRPYAYGTIFCPI